MLPLCCYGLLLGLLPCDAAQLLLQALNRSRSAQLINTKHLASYRALRRSHRTPRNLNPNDRTGDNLAAITGAGSLRCGLRAFAVAPRFDKVRLQGRHQLTRDHSTFVRIGQIGRDHRQIPRRRELIRARQPHHRSPPTA